jgi:hypothetical protein
MRTFPTPVTTPDSHNRGQALQQRRNGCRTALPACQQLQDGRRVLAAQAHKGSGYTLG